jgi:hypothetical protein
MLTAVSCQKIVALNIEFSNLKISYNSMVVDKTKFTNLYLSTKKNLTNILKADLDLKREIFREIFKSKHMFLFLKESYNVAVESPESFLNISVESEEVNLIDSCEIKLLKNNKKRVEFKEILKSKNQFSFLKDSNDVASVTSF